MKKRHLLLFSVFLFLVVITKAQQPQAAQTTKPYKYVIKGGHVIDPKNNIDGLMDIAISAPAKPDNGFNAGSRDGKIVLVAKNIDPNLAVQVIDASGLYVIPGLVDIHVHVFWGTDLEGTYRNGPLSVSPDGFALRTGVTTVVDAGTSGWKNFETFKKQTIDLSQTRVLAFLNIVGEGMAGGKYESNLSDMDAQKTAEMAKKYPNIIVGIKNAHFSGSGNDYLIPIERGIEAGKIAGNIPLMLDGRLDKAVFDRFRPGDIYTHVYGRAIVDSANNIKPFVLEARKKGIIFDTGFGGSSFRFSVGTPATKAGFFPNSISTDLHVNSMINAMKDMPNLMGFFMALGMDFKSVIRASTCDAAKIIKREELGNLSVGSVADVAIFNLKEGNFGFWASDGIISGTKRLENEMTIRGGQIVYNLNGQVKPIFLPQPPRQGSRPNPPANQKTAPTTPR